MTYKIRSKEEGGDYEAYKNHKLINDLNGGGKTVFSLIVSC